MPHIITEPCIGTKDASCVAVCPVDCIHPRKDEGDFGADKMLYIDPDTNLIASQTYLAGGPGQPLVEELFSDYKVVSGVQVAFTATVRQAGQSVAERHVDSIKFNAPLASALFKRP